MNIVYPGLSSQWPETARASTINRLKNCRVRKFRCIFALLAMLAASSALAMGHTTVIWPSGDVTGATDTQVLQDALAAPGNSAVIELQEGTFYINKPLTATDFRGVLRGVGMDRTVMTTVGTLEGGPDCPVWARPPSVDNPWPAVITFDGGRFALKDLGFRVPEPSSGTWKFADCANPDGPIVVPVLLTVVLITGDAQRTVIDRVLIEGGDGPDGAGSNLIQATYHIGLLGWNADTGFPGLPATGRHFVRRSIIRNADTGSSVENLTANSLVSFRHNVIEAPSYGFFVLDTGGRVDFSYNDVTAGFLGAGATQGANFALWGTFPVPSDLLPVRIGFNGNQITVNEGGLAGISTLDLLRVLPDTGLEGVDRLHAAIRRNHVVANGSFAGIIDAGSARTKIIRNEISGAVMDAGIRIGDSEVGELETTECRLLANDLHEVAADIAPIHLGSQTAGCLVLTDEPENDVLDDTDDPLTPAYDGNNWIIGLH